MLGRPPVLKLANRIESYVDINKKLVLNKHGKSGVGLTTIKTTSLTNEPDIDSEDLFDSGLELEITEHGSNSNIIKEGEVRGTMV